MNAMLTQPRRGSTPRGGATSEAGPAGKGGARARSATIPPAHRLLAHTADVGLTASAATLPRLFVEAAAALAELSADLDGNPPPAEPFDVALRSHDLAGLAFAWLNELIGLCDARHAALARTEVAAIEQRRASTGRNPRAASSGLHAAPRGPDAAPGQPAWDLTGRAWLLPYATGAARPRIGVKSATYHRLAVDRVPGGWRLVAFLDV